MSTVFSREWRQWHSMPGAGAADKASGQPAAGLLSGHVDPGKAIAEAAREVREETAPETTVLLLVSIYSDPALQGLGDPDGRVIGFIVSLHAWLAISAATRWRCGRQRCSIGRRYLPTCCSCTRGGSPTPAPVRAPPWFAERNARSETGQHAVASNSIGLDYPL